MENKELKGLMPYGTAAHLVGVLKLVDRLLEEVGLHVQIGSDDWIWDGEDEILTMCEDEDDTEAYREIVGQLKALREQMTTPPPEPPERITKRVLKKGKWLYIENFYDNKD